MIAVAVFVIVWVGYAVTTGDRGGWDALLTAVSVLLSWALARELDPDVDGAALIAAGLAVLAVLSLDAFGSGRPAIAPLFWLLIGMRVLNRTTGLAATIPDIAALMLIGLWAVQDGGWLYALLGIGVLALDGQLDPREPARTLGAAAIAALVGIWLLAGPMPVLIPPAPVPGLAAVLLALLALPAMLGAKTLAARSDVTDVPLQTQRVLAGQGLAIAAGTGAAVWHGWGGLVALSPLWAAVVASGGYRLLRLYLDRARERPS